MQTNDELKIIVEDIAKEAFQNQWDQTAIKSRITQKIITDEDREWALEKVRFKSERLQELQQYKKSGRSKMWQGSALIVLAILIPSIYSFIVHDRISFGFITIPVIIGIYLIWKGRNDLARY